MAVFDANPDVPGGGHARSQWRLLSPVVSVGLARRADPARALRTTTSRAARSTTIPIATRPSTPSRITCRPGLRTTRASIGTRPIYTSARTGVCTSAPTSRCRATWTPTIKSRSRSAFAHELTDEEHLPYTLAIHAGRDANGGEHNPHAHLMISERQNDGIEREPDAVVPSRELGESRARRSAQEPHVSRPRVDGARARALGRTDQSRCSSARGRDERVDHRSYERQGVDRRARASTTDRRRRTWPAKESTTSVFGRPQCRWMSGTPSAQSTARLTPSSASAGPRRRPAAGRDRRRRPTRPRLNATRTCRPGGNHAERHRRIPSAA